MQLTFGYLIVTVVLVGFLPSGARAATMETAIAEAENAVLEKRLVEARSQIEAILKESPKEKRAHFLAIRLEIAKRDYPQAVRLADEAIEWAADEAEFHLLRGIALSGYYDSRESHRAIEKAYTLAPENYRTRTYRARNLLYAGFPARALAELDDVIKKDPENQRAFRTRADVHSQMWNYGLALKDYETAAKLEPADWDTNRGFMQVFRDLQMLEPAASYADGLIAQEPHYFQHHLDRAKIAILMKDSEKATECYNRAVENSKGSSKPHYVRLLFNAGRLNIREKPEAFVEDLKVLLDDPDFRARALRFRAIQGIIRQDWSSVLNDLAEWSWLERRDGFNELPIVTADLDLPTESFFNEDYVASVRGELSRGLSAKLSTVVKELLAELKSKPDASDGKSVIFLAWQRDYDRAIAQAKKILSQQPEDIETKCLIVELLFRSGKGKEADQYLSEIDPGDSHPVVLTIKAELALLDHEDETQAKQLVKHAIERDPYSLRATRLQIHIVGLPERMEEAFKEIMRMRSFENPFSTGYLTQVRLHHLQYLQRPQR